LNHRPAELPVRQPIGAIDTNDPATHWDCISHVCPVSGLAVALLIAPCLSLEGVQWQQLLVFSVLPPAVLNYMLAEKFNISPQAVASMVLLGNLASMVTIPVMLVFLI
jgi:hypothetical protein